ncbi:MAG: transcriptional regulator [Flavobacteriales bacterium]|nr:transcriptional regulator [Flavobacteriales bacterium]
MHFEEAKQKFLQAWGALGSSWGVPRTMSQIHALLLVSPRPMSTEEIMDELNISRGNCNMNVRALIDWGLVQKELKAGQRKEFFVAEKDIWQVTKQVMQERRKRELEPLARILDQVTQYEGGDPHETQEFDERLEELKKMSQNADRLMNMLIKADENWFTGSLLKLVK